MSRYFLEVAYKGSAYSGFQVQQNANTIQAEIEKSILILQKIKIDLTGSSRTDAGVHALQNFFHFDYTGQFTNHFIYKVNALLPFDIVIKRLIMMKEESNCRFDAISREYKYFIYQHKDPFLSDRAFFYPYQVDVIKLQAAAEVLKTYNDFTSFSKRNTQAKTFICNITTSRWIQEDNCLIYNVKSNRFLRGMVKALVATMLKVGRGKMTLKEFQNIIEAKDCTKASFAVPGHGLFLTGVNYPFGYFSE